MEREKEQKSGALQRVVSAVGGVVCVLLGLLLICNLTIIIKGTLRPEQPPSVLGVTPFVVKSGSMSGSREGHLEVGDLILVASVEPQKLQVGDVIAFMEGKIIVTHRIIDVETGEEGTLRFRTQGDANNSPDVEPVPEENIVGICRGRIPRVGDFALFLQTPLGMLLFIGVPVLGFIAYDVIRRQRYANEERKQTAEMEAEIERLRALAGEKAKTGEAPAQTEDKD